jgi:sugar phosphate isomerase/epimerase
MRFCRTDSDEKASLLEEDWANNVALGMHEQGNSSMKTIQGPAIFLAQFAGDTAPFNSLGEISRWAVALGYKGVQIPTWDGRLFDLKRAAESRAYCEEIRGTLASSGLQLTELSTHLQGQLVAVHPAYDQPFDGFAPDSVRANPSARQKWAVEQLLFAAKASANLGLKAHATFPGALAWPYIYPWPQRPAGLIEAAFDELAKRWKPILDAFDAVGVDVCYELHPGEDLHDGVSFEMFLERVGGHPRCNILFDPSHFVLQQLDYLEFIDLYHSRIKMFHVRTPSSTRAAAREFTADISPGLDARAASGLSETVRWISVASSPNSRSTIFQDGRCWNGSAV